MPRLLPDPAAKETDRILSDLEKRIRKEYRQALKEADAKWQKYMQSFEAADAKEADRLASGEITKQQYQEWRLRHLAHGKQWEEMRNVLAHDYHNRNVIAAKLTNGTMPDVYAVNANYGTYLVEHGAKVDTAFSLYNHDSAEALLKEEWSVSPETGKNSFLPKPSEKKKRELAQAKRENPDVLWNKQKLQSVMMQGVLSGEPLTQLAKRLAGVAEMDEHQAIRNARTMTTNVQSKGRMDSFDRAAKLGVDLMDEWVAILDGATRHSHRHMHGERKPHDSKVPFSNGCTRPGDPSGPAAEVYNCRCRIISWVKGFEGDTVKKNPGMGDMSFEEWQEAKAPKPKKTKEASETSVKTMNPAEYDKWLESNAAANQEDANWDDIFLTESHFGHVSYIQSADGSAMINKYWRTGGDIKYIGKWDRTVNPQNLSKAPKKLQEIYRREAKEIKETSDALDRMIGSYKTKEDLILDRWSGAGTLKNLGIDIGSGTTRTRFGHCHITEGIDHKAIADQINNTLVGARISDKGYSSASVCAERNIFRGSDVKYSILAPKGTNMYVTRNAAESEVILGRGVEMEIVEARVIDTEAVRTGWDDQKERKATKTVEIILRIVQS